MGVNDQGKCPLSSFPPTTRTPEAAVAMVYPLCNLWVPKKPMVPWVVLIRHIYFPEELIVMVLKTLDPNERRDRGALRVCLRLSQQFRALSLPLAYTTVRGYSTIPGLESFMSVVLHFTTYPTIAHTVTTLILGASSSVPWSKPSLLPSINICVLTTIGSILYQLQTLRLYRAALTACTCWTHSHRWISGFRLQCIDLQCVNLPMTTTIAFGELLLSLSIDMLKIGQITVQEHIPHPLITTIPPSLPYRALYKLSVGAVQVFPGTRRALRRLTEVKMDALNSLQLGDLDWTAWASVGTLLHEHKNTLKTLVLCMSIMDEENVEDPEEVWQTLPWSSCTMLRTAVLTMLFDDRQTYDITSLQLQWFAQWMERLPGSTNHIRIVMDCSRVIDQDTLEEWLEESFPWTSLAREIADRAVDLVEVEVVHDFFTWEDFLEGSIAEACLGKELTEGKVRLLESDWHPFPEEF